MLSSLVVGDALIESLTLKLLLSHQLLDFLNVFVGEVVVQIEVVDSLVFLRRPLCDVALLSLLELGRNRLHWVCTIRRRLSLYDLLDV